MRMTEDVRNELVVAIEEGRVSNASAFAREFAVKHGLNPGTVRTTISRLRRGVALETARYRIAGAMPGSVHPAADMLIADPGDERAIRLAAAAVARYERDPAFRAAVEGQLDGMRKLLEKLRELREASIGVLSDEGDPPSFVWVSRGRP